MADGEVDGGVQLRAEAVEVFDRQLRRSPCRRDARVPESLIRKEVADSGERSLIEQPRLDRRVAGADAPSEVVLPHVGRIGSDMSVVRVEDGPTETAAVPQCEPAAIGELDREAIPQRLLMRGFESDVAGHPEVQAKRRPCVGLEPKELAASMSAYELVADESGLDFPRLMRAADVCVAVVDCGDSVA